jgi:hypothetical protein
MSPQMAEVAISRNLFSDILRMIPELRLLPSARLADGGEREHARYRNYSRLANVA